MEISISFAMITEFWKAFSPESRMLNDKKLNQDAKQEGALAVFRYSGSSLTPKSSG
jgi:hypothetical protein